MCSTPRSLLSLHKTRRTGDLITLASVNSRGKPHCLVSGNEFRLVQLLRRRAAASGSSSRRQIHWLIAIVL
ncbi:hypothetical protein CesoFtcFv8_017958 [Champsocephalus esox]|uniref:Uncharacterized protein n=1 Tax=Champsocephalus esox TaxID=159716 RepID=A0AAN8BLA3_9TELE|nr:hypothetical protein CesoFtcFv8_017958 [Champsocephalus esox]